MCKKLRRFGAIPIAVAAIGMALTAAPARAAVALTMQISATGATTQTVPATASPLITSTTIGDFSLSPATGSTLGSSPSQFILSLGGTFSYSAASGPATAQVLTVDLSAINVTQPSVPGLLTMISTLSGSFTTSPGIANSTLELKTWVNGSNTPFTPSGPPNTDSGVQTIPIGSVTNSSSGTVAGTGGPPAMYAVDVVLTWTVPAGTTGTVGLSPGGSTNVTAATPAPSNLVLAFTSLPLLGVATWIRRRKAKA